MLKTLRFGGLATAALLMFAACSPSTKGETTKWENNKKSLTELSAKWPGFKAQLDADHKKAQTIWDEAAKLTDEDKKAEKMKMANASLTLIGKVGQVKSKSKGIEDLIKKINKLKLPKDKSRRRSSAVSEARDALSAVDTAMSNAKPADMEAAKASAQEQISALISARGALDRAYKSVKPKSKKKKKKKKL